MQLRAALVSGLILSLCAVPAAADAWKVLKCTGHNPMDHDISNRYVLNLTQKTWGDGSRTTNPLVIDGNNWILTYGPQFPQKPEGTIDATTLVMSHYGAAARMDLTLTCHIDNS